MQKRVSSSLTTPDPLDPSAPDALGLLVGIAIPDEFRAGVQDQLELNRRIISPLLSFDLPEGVTPAPEFEP